MSCSSGHGSPTVWKVLLSDRGNVASLIAPSNSTFSSTKENKTGSKGKPSHQCLTLDAYLDIQSGDIFLKFLHVHRVKIQQICISIVLWKHLVYMDYNSLRQVTRFHHVNSKCRWTINAAFASSNHTCGVIFVLNPFRSYAHRERAGVIMPFCTYGK